MFRSYFHLIVVVSLAIIGVGAPSRGLAQSGSWSNTASGSWGTTTNWTGGIIANGANNTATFATANLTTPVTVTLDINRTIGNLLFDNTTNNFGWTLRGSPTLTLSNTTTPTITVNNANMSATLTATLAGTQGFIKSGPGTLSLTANNTGLTGGITVSQGIFTVTGSATINPLGSNVVTLGGGTLRLGSGGGFNQRMVVPVGTTFATSGITATMDGGTTLGGNTWYELGQNTAAPTTGLPMGQTVASLADPSIMYTLQSATSRNALMLDNAGGNTTGRFTLATPTALTNVSFLTSSGNGAGTVTATLHYADGTPDATGLTFTSADWFNNTPIAINANGRIAAGGYNNVNGGNPRLYDATIANPNPTNPISSIDLSWTGGTNTHTAIFAVSTPVLNGDPAQNFTNNVVVTADSTIDIRTVAGATLGNVSIGTNTLSITGITGATLGLGAITMTGNATVSPDTGVIVTAGALSDGGTVRTFTKAGAGTLTLTAPSPGLSAGANAVVSAGTVNLNNATALGASSNVTVNAGSLNFGTGVSPTFASLGGTGGVVRLNGNTLTLGSGTATYAGSIVDGSAAGSLVKSGAGTQTLAGGNSFTGGVTVASGTLVATAPGALGAGAVTLMGGTLAVGGTSPVSITGFGNDGTGYTLNGGATVLNNVLRLTDATGGQARSAFNNTRVPVSAFTASFTYNASNGSTNPADGATITFQNDPRGAAALGDTGGALGYGGGAPITPSAAFILNLYNPNTRGVGVTTNGVTGGPYTAVTPVELYNTNVAVTITYDGTNLSATLNDGTNNFAFGPIAVNLASVVGGSTALIGFTGGTGGELAQQEISNFAFSAPAVSTYANAVNVAASQTGTINVIASAAVPTITMGALSLAANANLTVGPAASTPANQSFGLTFGAVTLAGTHTITVANNGTGIGTLTFGAVSGTGPLTKAGAGTLILSAAGTYTGQTNVNGGRLLVTNTTGSATGTGLVAVNSGGTLGGTGTVGGNLTVAAGGFVAPGLTAPGKLTIGGSATFTGGTMSFRLNGTTAGTGYDQLAVGGALALGSGVATLSTSLGYAPAATDSLTIVTAGSGGNAGTFAGLANNASFLVGSFGGTPYTAVIQYSPTAIVLTGFQPVPEPAHVLLIAAGVGGLYRWRRRRMA
ncbi:MAG: autotransporter-associated beta strand repeat-containing protein [Gemmataceae bacterium]